jgi:hypothetical protein
MFAEVLKPWLEQVLPGTEVWLSSEDIDKGTIWFTEIINELSNCDCGVLCITRENFLSPWIHFEAGGMIKGLGKSKVAAILLDINYGELKQPLNQFNGLQVDEIGAKHLVKSFNKALEKPIKDSVVDRAFETFWPELRSKYSCLFPNAKVSEGDEGSSYYTVPPPKSGTVSEKISNLTNSSTNPAVHHKPHCVESSPSGRIHRNQQSTKHHKKKVNKENHNKQLNLFDCQNPIDEL